MESSPRLHRQSLIALFVFFFSSAVQADIRYVLITTSGDTVKAIKFGRFVGDSLEAETPTGALRIHVDQIREINEQTTAWSSTAEIIGGISGFLGLVTYQSKSQGSDIGGPILAFFATLFDPDFYIRIVLFTAFGAAMGAAIGTQIAAEEKNDLSDMSPEERREFLKELVE